jgi:hypothetical protein
VTYVSWGALYEGSSDAEYYNVLIPRLMEEIVVAGQTRNITIPASPSYLLKRGAMATVAEEICLNRDSFHLVFVHADTGGRNLEPQQKQYACETCDQAFELCDWPRDRCIVVAPRKEMEAWALCDPAAVCESLGYAGAGSEIGLPATPQAAERLPDPKATLTHAIREVRGRRRVHSASEILPFIAQEQRLTKLRQMPSFRRFENDCAVALRSLGCIQ